MTTAKDIETTLAGTDQFYEELGRFVLKFAETEGLLQAALWHFSGLDRPTARAVFSNANVERVIDLIGQIAKAQNWPTEKETRRKRVLEQLDRIKKLRNNILHYGAQLEGPDAWRIPKYVTTISPETLKAAEQDLNQIDILLYDLMFEKQSNLDQASLAEKLKYDWKYRLA
jgi:hypothetical protein